MSTADLLCTVAHPDDESFGLGSVLAGAAQAGARVVLVCATLGEQGDDASGLGRTGPALAEVREHELRRAARELGVAEVELLRFADSGWEGPPPAGALVDGGTEVVDAVHEVIMRHRPRVVVTMDPTGSDGHRDHMAIGRATTTAFASEEPSGASLYHWCLLRSLMDRWAAERGGEAGVYGEVRLGRPDGDITTVLDGRSLLDVRRRAIAAHASQASPFDGLSAPLEADFLTTDHLVRVAPRWAGPAPERALLGLASGS